MNKDKAACIKSLVPYVGEGDIIEYNHFDKEVHILFTFNNEEYELPMNFKMFEEHFIPRDIKYYSRLKK